MSAGVLGLCPICRARLDASGPCRRCKAELGAARRVAEESAAAAAVGLRLLACGDRDGAFRSIRRANALRTAPDLVWILSALDGADQTCAGRGDGPPAEYSGGSRAPRLT